LSEREKHVADTNAQIAAVRRQSEVLAQAIYDLPDAPEASADFAPLFTAYQAYRQEVDRLNNLIHQLAAVAPDLTEHLRDSFDPAMEEANALCDDSIATFRDEESDPSDYQRALTSLCLCVERYASAVTAVSRAYANLPGS
ncbi:MAG: hypothetical protein KC561_06805, partial [Myxococcales bacterium]|nr:hypothetical protein [Myxococcales bacterium]